METTGDTTISNTPDISGEDKSMKDKSSKNKKKISAIGFSILALTALIGSTVIAVSLVNNSSSAEDSADDRGKGRISYLAEEKDDSDKKHRSQVSHFGRSRVRYNLTLLTTIGNSRRFSCTREAVEDILDIDASSSNVSVKTKRYEDSRRDSEVTVSDGSKNVVLTNDLNEELSDAIEECRGYSLEGLSRWNSRFDFYGRLSSFSGSYRGFWGGFYFGYSSRARAEIRTCTLEAAEEVLGVDSDSPDLAVETTITRNKISVVVTDGNISKTLNNNLRRDIFDSVATCADFEYSDGYRGYRDHEEDRDSNRDAENDRFTRRTPRRRAGLI